MSLESATWISDLDTSNPTGSDTKSQGDDHLRLIKSVLKACFPTASKAWYNPTTTAKTVNFSVAASEMNKTFLIDTSAGVVTATLPTLVAGDAGWECFFIKTTSDVNPIFIAPPSGTIQSGDLSGLTKTRRCIPGHRFNAIWTGTAWIAGRILSAPVGSVLSMPHGSSVPVGYELAYGQTLTSASTNYPDFYSRNGNSGVVADMRGRSFFGRDDMGGSAAGRLTNALSSIVGTTLGATGGLEAGAIAQNNLPNLALTGATTIGASTAAILRFNNTLPNPSGSGTGAGNYYASNGDFSDPRPITFGTITTTITVAGSGNSLNGGVTQVQFPKMPPTFVTNFIVIVE